MQFTIHKDELARGLHLCQSVADKRTAMPILSHVLVEAREGEQGMTFTATDMEVGIRVGVTAAVEGAGSIALPAKHLSDIVRQLPDEDISVRQEPDNLRVHIVAGPLQYKVPGMSAEEFPPVPAVEDAPTLELEPTFLRDMLTKTAFASSTDETRYNLNGIFFELIDGSSSDKLLRLVATDGHRLAMVEGGDASDRPEGAPVGKGVIIPRKGVAEMRRILDASLPGGTKGDGCIIGFHNNHGLFRRGGVTLVMRLIDGQFPDYRQVVPSDNDKKLSVGREALLRSLRQVSVLTHDQNAQVTRLGLRSHSMEVVSTGQDGSEARTMVDTEYNGEDFDVGFNARYVMDVLEVCTEDMVEFSLSDDVSPAVVQPAGNPDYRCVVMPMRI